MISLHKAQWSFGFQRRSNTSHLLPLNVGNVLYIVLPVGHMGQPTGLLHRRPVLGTLNVKSSALPLSSVGT